MDKDDKQVLFKCSMTFLYLLFMSVVLISRGLGWQGSEWNFGVRDGDWMWKVLINTVIDGEFLLVSGERFIFTVFIIVG
jgi:hypothetical protein